MEPRLGGRVEMVRRARDRLGSDVDDTVQVQHGEVVGIPQRLRTALQHTPLPSSTGAGHRLPLSYDARMVPDEPIAAHDDPNPGGRRPFRLDPFRGLRFAADT